MVNKDLVRDLNQHSFSSKALHSARIQEFLLLLAVCNTVVCSDHPHQDIMNASGKFSQYVCLYVFLYITIINYYLRCYRRQP